MPSCPEDPVRNARGIHRAGRCRLRVDPLSRIAENLATERVRPDSRLAQWYTTPAHWLVNMFIFISHLTVPIADQQELERHFRERARLVDNFPGFIYLQLLKPQAGDATHTFLTAWRDREAFRTYMRSVEHATSHAREPAAIMARSEVRHEAFAVMMDSRSDPEWLADAVLGPDQAPLAGGAHVAAG